MASSPPVSSPFPPESARLTPAQRDAVGFVLRMGKALHSYGYPAHRLEEVMDQASSQLGLQGQFFSTPTSIFAAFGIQEDQHTFLIRVEPGSVDLGRLARLNRVISRVLRNELPPAAGSLEVDQVLHAPPLYGRLVTTLAFGLASAAAARFLGGGSREILVASLLGLMIGLLALAAERVQSVGRVFEPLAAFLASLAASTAGAWVGPYSVYNATLAGLIVLVPGLTLTVAMTELSTRHLVSGTARLSGAFVLFLAIAFGVALGARIAAELTGSPVIVEPVALPAWTEIVALITAPLAFTVLLRAESRDAPWIVLAGFLAVAGGRIGAQSLGLELGVFVGSFMVGIASNVYARVLDRPATIILVPGILLLVPGSIGFRSLASLLDREVVLGVETAFRMVLMAVALVSGMLLSNVLAPVHRDGR